MYRNVYSYSRLMTEWECVETVTTNEAGLICGISRNRVRHNSSVWVLMSLLADTDGFDRRLDQ